MTVWKMDTCYHTCRVRYGHLVPLRQGWLEDPASPHGSSVPFNDAVVVLKVKCHQLHLLIELLHAIQGRRKRGGYGRGPSRPAQASPTPRGPPPSLSLFLPPRHGMWLNPSALSPKLSTLPPHSSPYTHTHTHSSPTLTGGPGPLVQGWDKQLLGAVTPQPLLLCPEGAGAIAGQGSERKPWFSQRGRARSCYFVGEAQGGGKKRVTGWPTAGAPGAPTAPQPFP